MMNLGTKHLFILRGIPGSGKSTIAELIARYTNVAADDYFDIFNSKNFDPKLLGKAHQWCFAQVEDWMQQEEEKIAVHNTFTREWEYKDYIKLAKKYGYTVHVMVVENHHGNKSVHNVPEDKIQQMRDRFEVKI